MDPAIKNNLNHNTPKSKIISFSIAFVINLSITVSNLDNSKSYTIINQDSQILKNIVVLYV
jgi:hypothetical protein